MSKALQSFGQTHPRVMRVAIRCVVILAACFALVLLARASLALVPLPKALFLPPTPSIEIVDRTGKSLRTARAGDAPFQTLASESEIPQALVQATLAAEDRRFWSHSGVDALATTRAAGELLFHRHVISGASTITQQLIKLAEPRPRTLRTKMIEALQALRLEQVWDKHRIICEYLNRIDYGNFNIGCAAASRFYLNKPLRDLSPAECAFLAGLPQGPTRLNPLVHQDRALKRQQWILGQMRDSGWLTEAEFRRASQEPLHLAKPGRTFAAPHFVDLLLQQTDDALPHGQTLRTTLDLALNRFCESSLKRHLAELEERHVRNGALVVIDNHSGEVLALVGSENYFSPASGQVNGAWSPRSSGSALKPFTYLLAVEQGATPATIVADTPTEFATATGLFAPVNFNRHCYGPVRYRIALANSLNIPAVKVLDAIGGPEALQRRLRECGITTLTRSAADYGLGLTIGNGEVRLLELANAYASLARLGEYRPYTLLLDELPAAPVRVADPGAAWLIADILSDNDARAMAFGVDTALRFEFPVACKTGTSSDFRDNWAFGYTPEFTVGVWVGNFDGSPMVDISGVTGAAPILHDIFEHLHARARTSWYAPPPKLVTRSIHPITGRCITIDSPRISLAIQEKFIGNVPSDERPDDYDSAGRILLPHEYAKWMVSADNNLSGRIALGNGVSELRILFPPPGTTIFLDPDLPDSSRRLHLEAEGSTNLEWSSDSLRCTNANGRQIAFLTKGRHILRVRDAQTGAQSDTWINVVEK